MVSPEQVKKAKWFQVLEIEVNTKCNLKCSYCPQSKASFRKPEARMPVDLFDHILDMVSQIDFSGRLSFHHYNEPLLRKDLSQLVEKARDKLPKAFIALYTNGILLNDKRYHSLLTAGVDHFFISNHENKKIIQRDYQEVRSPGDFVLSGRAGIIGSLQESSTAACYAPSEMMIVRQNGDVVLCHEDATSKHVMGNLSQQTLEEVWFGELFLEYRQLLENGERRKAGGICELCDNFLHPLPDTGI